MVPTRTLPIVVQDRARFEGARANRPRSILRRLATSLGAARHRSRAADEAAERRDRALELIEHRVCDCV